MYRRQRPVLLFFALVLAVGLACNLTSSSNDGPPRNAAVVNVTANTSLASWLNQAVRDFNQNNKETVDGKPVYVTLNLVESGRAVADMANDGPAPALWIPEEVVWTSVLADQGQNNFTGDCVTVAESPLVIAMWRPVAERLGWPGTALGWLDVGSLAADPPAWSYYSGGEFGDVLRLGHTHPGLSASGASTLLAIVQAAGATTEAVTVGDIEQPIVQASVGAFEAAVSWFSPTTLSLAQTMSERGITYLGAAVMYENNVLDYGAGDPEIVPIYPFEGTFMASHPACLNATAVAESRQAATLFRNYLLSQEGQRLAVSKGLRPADKSTPIGAPLDASRGVNLNEPQRLFNAPSVATIYAIQELWQDARKHVNLVMLLDVSGSMRGNKMEGMRAAAVQFVRQMGDDDYITIITFADNPVLVVNQTRVGDDREAVIRTIQGLSAGGYTALFDAIGDGATTIAETSSPDRSNVLVVLTDGQDTSSSRYAFNDRLIQEAIANDTTVFTIAYGSDADERLMTDLALRANGNYYKGDEANIDAIYEEMSAAFGGAVGVGR
jgi:Ca-activated chloride channel homolog